MSNLNQMYKLSVLLAILLFGCHSDMTDRNNGSARAIVPKEPVRAELIRLQKETGLTLASFSRYVRSVIFADRLLSDEKELLPKGSAGDGAISRDGIDIAFGFMGPPHSESLGIVRRDAGNLREYPEIVAPYSMCWSYDKTNLAMSVANLGRGTTPPNDNLQILNLDSRKIQVIDSNGYLTSQCWSPDGKQIVYTANGGIQVYNIDQKQWRVLAKGKEATWSPDGNWIAFLDDDTYYAIRPSGDERKLLFQAKGALTGLWWSPDSRIVAYVSRNRFFEGPWKVMDVGMVRLRVRRLDDDSEDWVVGLSDAYVPNYQWIGGK
jgi:hypothetical protein